MSAEMLAALLDGLNTRRAERFKRVRKGPHACDLCGLEWQEPRHAVECCTLLGIVRGDIIDNIEEYEVRGDTFNGATLAVERMVMADDPALMQQMLDAYERDRRDAGSCNGGATAAMARRLMRKAEGLW